MSDGTLIWITGASQGIGKALVQAVPWQEARVIGVSRSPGPTAVHLAADLAGPVGWDMLEASFHREMAGFSGGRVVFLHAAGAIGPVGFAGETAYGAAKAAVDQWVRAAGDEQARRGEAQVISVNPGRVATAMHEHLRATQDDQLPGRREFIRLHEEGLLRDPRDVARRLWSLLDDQGIMPGQVLDLSGYPAART